jgi:alpha-tubulin suppressor-like RCC1 family protein
VPAKTFVALAAGMNHTCGLASDHTIACWGRNTVGQTMPPAGAFVAIGSGHDHTCAIDGAGTVTCWGDNQYLELRPVVPGVP